MSATQARTHFAEIIDRVQYLGEQYVIEKQGKPAALITKIESGNKKRKTQVKKMTTNEFLLKLTQYNLKGGPKNLAQEHDKYTWE